MLADFSLYYKATVALSGMKVRKQQLEQAMDIETYILSCKKQIASLHPMQDTACLGLVHGDDPERCYAEGGERGVPVWERMYTCGGFISMYGKTNTVL